MSSAPGAAAQGSGLFYGGEASMAPLGVRGPAARCPRKALFLRHGITCDAVGTLLYIGQLDRLSGIWAVETAARCGQ